MNRLDDIDKKILNRIQSNFPITTQPYLAVADELDLAEKEVLLALNQGNWSCKQFPSSLHERSTPCLCYAKR